MNIKRYEIFTREGKKWGKWFPWNGVIKEKWQLKNKLKNEYKEVSEEEWKKMDKEQG